MGDHLHIQPLVPPLCGMDWTEGKGGWPQVTALDAADKNPRKIANWVQSIQDLHKNKPRPQVSYTKNMPDIEGLMEEWPPELEEMLKHLSLPDGAPHFSCDRAETIRLRLGFWEGNADGLTQGFMLSTPQGRGVE